MATIRMAFKAWLDGEPEELESDHPTEEEMKEYERAEKVHAALVSWTKEETSLDVETSNSPRFFQV